MLLSLRTALSSLNTAQSALSVVANNVANAATPGYTRQRVTLGNVGPTTVTATSIAVGRGVQIASLDRISSALLNEQIREQQSYVGRYAASADFLTQIESFLGEPNGSGISDRNSALFASITALSSAPEDPARRTDVIQDARDVADLFNLLSRQVGNVADGVQDAIHTEVQEINGLLVELKALNDSIGSTFLSGHTPSDFLDQQDRLLRELSDRIDVRVNREESGRVTIFSGNAALVSPTLLNTVETRTLNQVTGEIGLELDGSSTAFTPLGGRLKGLMDLADGTMDSSISDLDALSRSMMLEFNRVFSTGVPANGGYLSLASTNRFVDTNNSGSVLDDRIGNAGLPFDVQDGRFAVNVTDEATGDVRRSFITVDPVSTTVGDLVNQLDAVDGIRAFVDTVGNLRIASDAGSRFDFSSRVLENPDPDGAFGSARATAVGSARAPISIAAGSSFSVEVNGAAPVVVTLASAHTSMESLAAEINTTLNASGAEAFVSNGVLAIRSNTSYPNTSSIRLTDGVNGPLSDLGLPTALVSGGQQDVEIEITGSFTDTRDRSFTFTPNMDGEIGVTPGLEIEVRDEIGNLVSTLEVGSGYTPGDEMSLFGDLSISFGAGEVQSSGNQSFQATFLADSDTSDLLAAVGMGTLFTGSNASTMGVRDALFTNPDLFAAGLTGSAGDSGNLDRLMALRETQFDSLSGDSFDGFYQGFVTDLAIETNRATSTRDSQGVVLSTLAERQQSISGVNIDEELLMLEQYQQMYQASARFLTAIQEVTDELLNLI